MPASAAADAYLHASYTHLLIGRSMKKINSSRLLCLSTGALQYLILPRLLFELPWGFLILRSVAGSMLRCLYSVNNSTYPSTICAAVSLRRMAWWHVESHLIALLGDGMIRRSSSMRLTPHLRRPSFPRRTKRSTTRTIDCTRRICQAHLEYLDTLWPDDAPCLCLSRWQNTKTTSSVTGSRACTCR